MLFNFFNLYNYDFYSFSIFIFNIYIYIFLISNIFLILLIFDLTSISVISDLRFLKINSFLYFSIILIFLSLAGFPPLLGFIGKFLIFLYIFYKNNIFVSFLFIIINIFSIYFYLQNLKFLVSKNYSLKQLYSHKYNYINSSFFKFLILLNFINIFGIIYIEEFFIFLNFLCSYLYIN